MIYMLVGLILFDVVLLWLLLRKDKHFVVEQSDLVEERQYLIELRKSIQENLNATLDRCQAVQKSVAQLALDAEQEVKLGSASIGKELEELVDELTKRFDKPLDDLKVAHYEVDHLFKRFLKQKDSAKVLLERIEDGLSLLKRNQGSDDIIDDIREKRYSTARKMIASGSALEAVSSELNLPIGEVRLLAGM
jgi:hypothetical protein